MGQQFSALGGDGGGILGGLAEQIGEGQIHFMVGQALHLPGQLLLLIGHGQDGQGPGGQQRALVHQPFPARLGSRLGGRLEPGGRVQHLGGGYTPGQQQAGAGARGQETEQKEGEPAA